MAETTFLIAALATGNNPNNWAEVQDLLSAVSPDITLRALAWEYYPYARADVLVSGHDKGRGLPSARWTLKGMRFEQRENLKDFCAGLSAEVYIRTPSNETVAGVRTWIDRKGIMHWTAGSELVGISVVEMVEMRFTRLEAI